jgi:hypothetical protein
LGDRVSGAALQRSQKFANPFYGLLVLTGLLFALTAISYGVMAFREARPRAADAQGAAAGPHPLMEWMSEHGEKALLVELAFLAAFTFAAIGTDSYWQQRAAVKNK